MSVAVEDLWGLVMGRPEVDPDALAGAIVRQVMAGELDYRTRLLIRDSLDGLRQYWGAQRYERWLADCEVGQRLRELAEACFETSGFPSLRDRIMDSTKPQSVLEYLRELGTHLDRPAVVVIGGSTALLLADLLSRHTEDIDVVDEVPAEIRGRHEMLANLERRYGLRLAHFQSHYLPEGWEKRRRSLGVFGRLRVFLIDPMDIFVGKLFSRREKDRDDLRALSRRLEKGAMAARLRESGQSLLADPGLRGWADDNWYVLYGERLPAAGDMCK